MRPDAAARTGGRAHVFKILHLNECPVSPMAEGRGEQIKLINASLGTEKLDLHFNRLFAGGGHGKLHHPSKADNAYNVKRREGMLTPEGGRHICAQEGGIYHRPGVAHSL